MQAMKTLGSVIREAREQRGLSVLDLALSVGVSQSTISRLENNEYARAPKPELLGAVARKLKLSEFELVKLAGYRIGEESPAYDPLSEQIARATASWSPRQKALLWQYVQDISAALDSRDPPVDDDNAGMPAAATGS